jgi:hypothetical protein
MTGVTSGIERMRSASPLKNAAPLPNWIDVPRMLHASQLPLIY